MIFDSHAHYDDEAFDEDRESLLGSMQENGIGYIVNVGASIRGVEETVKLTKSYPFIYGAVGIHPDDTGDLNEERMIWLEQLCGEEKIVAVGEIGLDYYWDKESRELQKEWFARQLALSKKAGLPVIIHSRDAAQDTIDIMKAEHAGSTGGVIHCFSNSREMARDYVNMGYYIGIGGVVTFKNARVMKEVAEYVPLEQILIETDCPYLAPAPNRGKRNSSLFLPYIIEEIARIKGVSKELVEEKTCENALKMYRIR
ncbi:TatD family hydrolase [uncultured Robinsoniella sp.]|uniref:TatD family hydrolase n=1 Tax=uncultured Robinsoniella sp. TaxID=904190 RepID=UPI00374EC691